MPLTQKHRSSIYQSLSPILGEEETEALLSNLPSHDDDELVTRRVLRAELAEVRSDFHIALRQQTVWFAGALFVSIGLSTTIASLV